MCLHSITSDQLEEIEGEGYKWVFTGQSSFTFPIVSPDFVKKITHPYNTWIERENADQKIGVSNLNTVIGQLYPTATYSPAKGLQESVEVLVTQFLYIPKPQITACDGDEI